MKLELRRALAHSSLQLSSHDSLLSGAPSVRGPWAWTSTDPQVEHVVACAKPLRASPSHQPSTVSKGMRQRTASVGSFSGAALVLGQGLHSCSADGDGVRSTPSPELLSLAHDCVQAWDEASHGGPVPPTLLPHDMREEGFPAEEPASEGAFDQAAFDRWLRKWAPLSPLSPPDSVARGPDEAKRAAAVWTMAFHEVARTVGAERGAALWRCWEGLVSAAAQDKAMALEMAAAARTADAAASRAERLAAAADATARAAHWRAEGAELLARQYKSKSRSLSQELALAKAARAEPAATGKGEVDRSELAPREELRVPKPVRAWPSPRSDCEPSPRPSPVTTASVLAAADLRPGTQARKALDRAAALLAAINAEEEGGRGGDPGAQAGDDDTRRAGILRRAEEGARARGPLHRVALDLALTGP